MQAGKSFWDPGFMLGLHSGGAGWSAGTFLQLPLMEFSLTESRVHETQAESRLESTVHAVLRSSS